MAKNPMKLILLFAAVLLTALRLCGAQTVIPDPKNQWEADHLFVIDKDTSSTFLNANLLYVRSLGTAFPQVKTVDDVIGKTDFDFYPKELADKYRADDARVMASGQRFETIEQYSEGGSVGYVYTEKTPLKDAGGKVFGLRVRFYLIPAPNQTTIPEPGNEWERRHVFTIDKDVNSVFLNANALYLQSLAPAFPEIQSVTNLIGRDDFAFYPPDLADKYRADDARVMASGQRFETIEQYSEGGTVGYVYTEKTPLKDGAGKVFGLRVRFYLIPAPNQTTIPEPANAWERAHVQFIDKDTNSVFLNANALYLQSLGAAFPEIRSVTNFIGRDDFAFYPPDLAEKYRADDARVMASGQRFETIEPYSDGGVIGYVYTEKTPLKDAGGNVFGLRARFYRIPAPNQTTIPEPANAWERANVQVIDKDIHSVFLNANSLFLSSVRSVFPEIQSVTNLIGRDDFAFYPPDLAEKFRADDARVIASGQEFSTVEENQLEGGARTRVFVRKTPLRDSKGTITALRILFFVIPELQVGRLADGALELSWPEDATVFDLESADSVSGPWSPVGGTSTTTGGKIRQRIEPSGTARIFRLRQR